jgi:hypothetical protein
VKQNYAPASEPDTDMTQGRPQGQDKPVVEATKEVAQSAKDHVSEVGGEVAQQTRNIAGQVRERLTGEARSQNDKLASGLRQLADDLGQMGNGNGSTAATVVQQLSDGSRRAASYLEEYGPDGLLREAQDFARRRPGAFLLGAAVAGFVAGRLGKGLLASPSTSSASSGASRMTGVGVTPTGATTPTATGVAPAPIVTPTDNGVAEVRR